MIMSWCILAIITLSILTVLLLRITKDGILCVFILCWWKFLFLVLRLKKANYVCINSLSLIHTHAHTHTPTQFISLKMTMWWKCCCQMRKLNDLYLYINIKFVRGLCILALLMLIWWWIYLMMISITFVKIKLRVYILHWITWIIANVYCLLNTTYV